ncbi:translocation protein TolB [Planctomycetes bacterium Pan216]|uniref:Translocation protein TolB n=1 Tax=Kolteria novifilia TaxID=2527975 RepID=A0A518B8B8_9BACT|nr:translocation protein TolB [Planctomycetes bacterium Pan216]
MVTRDGHCSPGGWLPLLAVGMALVVTGSPLAQEKRETPTTLIHLTDPDGSDPKPLADLPEFRFQGSPAWSRDGTRVAFDAWQPQYGETNSDSQIVIVDANGKNPRVLIDGAMPSFSPRGKRIAFSRYSPNRGVWVMNAEDPEKELVLLDESGWSADWSPDGKSIAYTKYGSSGANIIVFDLVEGDRRFLFDEAQSPYRGIYWNICWSPDSKRIVYRAIGQDGQQEIGVVNAESPSQDYVTLLKGKAASGMGWSPDGKRVLVSRRDPERKVTQLYSLDADKPSAPERLKGQDPEAHLTDFAFAPDGKSLAVSVRKPAPAKDKAKK